jgi:hypothetical protein
MAIVFLTTEAQRSQRNTEKITEVTLRVTPCSPCLRGNILKDD